MPPRFEALVNPVRTPLGTVISKAPSKLSPKASLRFQPTKELLLRASAGTGYRAPTLFEILRPFTINNT